MKPMGSKKILPALGVALAAAVLLAAAAGALHLLNSRAQEAPQQPTVTADSLGGTDLAQSALTAAAGDGKNYAYSYEDGDIDGALENYRAGLEAERDAARQHAQQFRAEGNAELEALNEESARYLEEHLDEFVQEKRENLEREAEAVKDAIPPQEAANIAGRWIEQVYGIPLNDRILNTTFNAYSDPEAKNNEHPYTWMFMLPEDEMRTQAYLAIDALTGRVLETGVGLTAEEERAVKAQPLPEGAGTWQPNGVMCGYDLSNLSAEMLAAYQKEAEQIVALDAVSGPEGGAGWSVKMEVGDLGTGGGNDYVAAHVRYANGKTAFLRRLCPQGEAEYPGRLWAYTAGEAVA